MIPHRSYSQRHSFLNAGCFQTVPQRYKSPDSSHYHRSIENNPDLAPKFRKVLDDDLTRASAIMEEIHSNRNSSKTASYFFVTVWGTQTCSLPVSHTRTSLRDDQTVKSRFVHLYVVEVSSGGGIGVVMMVLPSPFRARR